MESDSQIANNAIAGWNQNPKVTGNIVEHIKKLAKCFRNIQFVYRCRKTNDLAHRSTSFS